MRYAEILSEAATTRDLTLYHGTDSAPFDGLDTSKAAKYLTYFNPLGQGLYATNSPLFAQKFGKNIHKVVIPAGASYKRVTPREWATGVGRNILFTAVKLAFKGRGRDYGAWKRGTATEPDPDYYYRGMTDWKVIQAMRALFPKKVKDGGITRADIQQWEALLQAKAPRVSIGDTREQVAEFERKAQELLDTYSPYESLKKSVELFDECFDDTLLTRDFQKIMPEIANRIFKNYDFVVFTETLDPAGLGGNRKSAMEFVIFNPELQRTQNLPLGKRIDAIANMNKRARAM